MSLDKTALKGAIQALAQTPGETIRICAVKWSNAIASYFGGVVPATTTAAVGQPVLADRLEEAFTASDPADVAANMEVAFASYAAAVALGMAGYTGAAPTTPVGFAALFAPPFEQTHDAAARKISDAIHAWAITGKATLIVLPNTLQLWA